MTVEAPLYSLTVKATGDVTERRFVDSTGVHATAAGRAMGVARVTTATGNNFGVHVLGTAIVEAGAAIAKDAAVEVGTNGKAVTFSAGTKVGIALNSASADGDLIEVLLIPNA